MVWSMTTTPLVRRTEQIKLVKTLEANTVVIAEPESVSPLLYNCVRGPFSTLLTSWVTQWFQFISETGLSRPRGAALRLIRSQSKRKNPTQNQNSLLKHKLRQPHQHISKTKSERRGKPSNPATPSVSSDLILRNAITSSDRNPASNKINPFSILQLDEHGDYQSWMNQCKWQQVLLMSVATTNKSAKLLAATAACFIQRLKSM